MNQLTVAFLHNIRHQYPDPDDPRSQLEADYDDPETISYMVQHLENCDYNVLSIEANEEAYLKLYRQKKQIDLVFNYSLGLHGQSGYAQIPAMLEMLQIPYTGSAPLTQALVMNKAKAKEIFLANNIPTLPFQLFITGQEKLHSFLKFPLIVKPVARGSSAGVTNKSIIFDKKELKKQVNHIIDLFKEPALVEPFLQGKEYSVPMLGNPPQILPFICPNHSLLPKDYYPLDTLEVKWHFEEAHPGTEYLNCPAKLSSALKEKISQICFQVWQVLGIRDWCRLDIRCDLKNNPYVLEVNSPPGCIPPEVSTTSYLPLSAKTDGLDYENLLKTVINSALKRYEPKTCSK